MRDVLLGTEQRLLLKVEIHLILRDVRCLFLLSSCLTLLFQLLFHFTKSLWWRNARKLLIDL